MSFTSIAFAVLFSLALLFRFTIGRTKKSPLYIKLLLVLSVTFYAWHIPLYIFILIASTIVDFVAGRMMSEPNCSERKRKVCLVTSLVVNLGLLSVFKYGDYLLGELSVLASLLGYPAFATLGLILPMGISFYTFQSMSYTIDIYRGKQEQADSFWEFFFYVSFFPQLVAGPIVRASDFLYQLKRRRSVNFQVFSEGIYLVVRGFFLKIAIADNVGHFVDDHWSYGVGPNAGFALNTTLAILFSFQIFCDFAGYSSIARGLAYLLGFRLPVNFNSPYIAASFSEFWRRWHITLSSWLRDYLYIPLGGNRGSRLRTEINLMIVMLLGGLWHGAANHFIVWGLIHGFFLAFERVFLPSRKSLGEGARVWNWIFVQIVILVTWVFFRAENVPFALAFLSNLGAKGSLYQALMLWMDCIVYFIPVICMHFRTYLEERVAFPRAKRLEKLVLTGVMLFLTLSFYGRSSEFIYFQF